MSRIVFICVLLVSVLVDAQAQIGAWTKKASMPVQGGSACVVNGKIHVFGGAGNGPSYNDLASNEVYDPLTDTWGKKRLCRLPGVFFPPLDHQV